MLLAINADVRQIRMLANQKLVINMDSTSTLNTITRVIKSLNGFSSHFITLHNSPV